MQTLKKQITVILCERCGNTWQPRVKNPVKCPKCGHRFDSRIIKPEGQQHSELSVPFSEQKVVANHEANKLTLG